MKGCENVCPAVSVFSVSPFLVFPTPQSFSFKKSPFIFPFAIYEERCLTYAQPITTVTRNRNFVSMVLITRIIIIVGERKKDRETERERERERERE